MCGRAALYHSWAEVHEAMSIIPAVDRGRNVPARYNIAPTQDMLFVDHEKVREGRWWLVPHWAKEMPKWAMFNARSEDAYKKPAFRDAFKSKRCIIPMSGYYEWIKSEDGGKDPHFIHLPDREPFGFAGLWAHNSMLDVTSCTILTAAADPVIEHLHHRMPIILPASSHVAWINPETIVDDARALLNGTRGNELVSCRVGREVNSSRAQGSQLIKPL